MALERVGRYEIVQTLGRGAMGVVYLARDPLIDRQVALKTLRLDLDPEMGAEFRERFLREARAAGRLNHRSIVTVHDVGEDPEAGLLYIAMEYIPGRDLREMLSAGQPLHPSEATRIAAQLAQALDYAHSMGVVHRDIKPANIILTEEGLPKITDFGVARLESSTITVDGQYVGTPSYMSPEQVKGAPVDGRSDLFSLGVVLFEMLTKQRPFAATTLHEVSRKIVEQPCPIPSTLAPQLPATLNPILLRCLEKDPARRFQTGAQLAGVLIAVARTLAQREAVATGPAPAPAATRKAAPTAPVKLPVKRTRRILAEAMPRVQLPDWLGWQVAELWFGTVVVGWTLLCALLLGTLWLRRDTGPFRHPAPDLTRSLHATVASLQVAAVRLAQGDAAGAEQAGLGALDQAPASTAGRRLVHEARRHLGEERSAAETLQKVNDLVEDGRKLYSQGLWADAAERFEMALVLEPASDLATSYLELARERQRIQVRPENGAADARRSGIAPRSRTLATPTPGTSRLIVFFQCPLNAGEVAVTLDGNTLSSIPFDFTRRGLLGIKRKGSGTVKRVLMAPAGRHTVGIQLADAERGQIGEATFTEVLAGGSDWSLRVELADDKRGTPRFSLTPVDRQTGLVGQ